MKNEARGKKKEKRSREILSLMPSRLLFLLHISLLLFLLVAPYTYAYDADSSSTIPSVWSFIRDRLQLTIYPWITDIVGSKHQDQMKKSGAFSTLENLFNVRTDTFSRRSSLSPATSLSQMTGQGEHYSDRTTYLPYWFRSGSSHRSSVTQRKNRARYPQPNKQDSQEQWRVVHDPNTHQLHRVSASGEDPRYTNKRMLSSSSTPFSAYGLSTVNNAIGHSIYSRNCSHAGIWISDTDKEYDCDGDLVSEIEYVMFPQFPCTLRSPSSYFG